MMKFNPCPTIQCLRGVKVLKNVGTFKKTDEPITVQVQKTTGRIYAPGVDEKGKFIDKVGKPDNRFMIFSMNPTRYTILTEKEMNECFDEVE